MENIEKIENKKKFFNKLFEIKKEISEKLEIKRDTEGYGYKYATLDQLQDKIEPILFKYNMFIYHSVFSDEYNTSLFTYIIDTETGENIHSNIKLNESIYEYKEDKDKIKKYEVTRPLTAQEVGSLITYYRRYNILCLLDIKTDDDDGALASNRTAPTLAKKTTTKKTEDAKWLNYKDLKYIIDDLGIKDPKELKEYIIQEKYSLSLECRDALTEYVNT